MHKSHEFSPRFIKQVSIVKIVSMMDTVVLCFYSGSGQMNLHSSIHTEKAFIGGVKEIPKEPYRCL